MTGNHNCNTLCRIHPRWKYQIADRLALGAYELAYGDTSEGRFQGPYPTEWCIGDGGKLHITFDEGIGMLQVRNTAGFEVYTTSADTYLRYPYITQLCCMTCYSFS